MIDHDTTRGGAGRRRRRKSGGSFAASEVSLSKPQELDNRTARRIRRDQRRKSVGISEITRQNEEEGEEEKGELSGEESEESHTATATHNVSPRHISRDAHGQYFVVDGVRKTRSIEANNADEQLRQEDHQQRPVGSNTLRRRRDGREKGRQLRTSRTKVVPKKRGRTHDGVSSDLTLSLKEQEGKDRRVDQRALAWLIASIALAVVIQYVFLIYPGQNHEAQHLGTQELAGQNAGSNPQNLRNWLKRALFPSIASILFVLTYYTRHGTYLCNSIILCSFPNLLLFRICSSHG